MQTFVVIATKRFHHIYFSISLYIIKKINKKYEILCAMHVYETFEVQASSTFKKFHFQTQTENNIHRF